MVPTLITKSRSVYIETIHPKCNANTRQVIHSPGDDTHAAAPGAYP